MCSETETGPSERIERKVEAWSSSGTRAKQKQHQVELGFVLRLMKLWNRGVEDSNELKCLEDWKIVSFPNIFLKKGLYVHWKQHIRVVHN